ncbi:MAG: site-specific DNA-methyltransferase, partial [Bacteroidetes bacterium]|nr:site-specific DNA-methyltransferase [Bacteroidota bacterium]
KMVEPDEGFINHPSPKPKNFISELLKMFSKERDIILDPFIGSGSTALACLLCNRNFIGFEIEKEYCDLAINRLERLRYRKT